MGILVRSSITFSIKSKIKNADQFQNQCRNNFWWYKCNKSLWHEWIQIMNIFLMTQQVTNISKVQFSSISKMNKRFFLIFQLVNSKWAQLRASISWEPVSYIIKVMLSNFLVQEKIFYQLKWICQQKVTSSFHGILPRAFCQLTIKFTIQAVAEWTMFHHETFMVLIETGYMI